MIKDLNKLKSAIKVSIDDENFFKEAFTYVSEERKSTQKFEADNFKRICQEEYEELSRQLDATLLQDSSSVRNNLKTRRIAKLLIDEKGFLNVAMLKHLIATFKDHLYFLGPGREVDSKGQEKILSCLELLLQDKAYARALHAISKPHNHPLADQMIRDTLQLPENTKITDAHARRAALSAWLCYLRQALGSCFATAPAIIVHEEHPLKFFNDLIELFGTGSLKRTFGGVEYSVPFNPSSGAGDLKKPFYLSPNWEEMDLYSQPGLIHVLELEGIIDAEVTFEKKRAVLKKYIAKYIEKKVAIAPYMIGNPEEMIRDIFLTIYSLTEQDLQEYESRAFANINPALLMQVPPSKMPFTGKNDTISKFKSAFSRAKRAFKSFSDNALLRSWEYTIASFAETKGEFSKWNLYSSLGLKHSEPGGIGAALYLILKNKLDRYNREVEEYQYQYDQIFTQVRVLENRLKRASSEDEAHWLKVDYRAKIAELDVITEFRNRAYFHAQKIANLYDILINFYIELFPEYFQEVYDPEILDVSTGPYDDTPAGFRLMCKHGRTNSAQWTIVANQQEFIDSLVAFFTAAERRIDLDENFQGLSDVVSEITSEIISQVRTKEFLETALHRMAIAHNKNLIENPLENLDKVEKKPWVYTSGGNFQTLVSVYFRIEHKPTSLSRWVESPQELLLFLVDTLKQVPQNILNDYINNPKKSMLMYSPTHAFILKPGEKPFSDAWKSQDYSYTWIRDHLIFPMERFNEAIILSSDAIHYLVKRLQQHVPINFRHYFYDSFSKNNSSMSMQFFRDFIIYGMDSNRGLQVRGKSVLPDYIIDKELYRNVPIFPMKQLKEHLKIVLSQLPNISKKEVDEALWIQEEFTARFFGENVIGALQFQNVCKALICMIKKKTSFAIDYHTLIKRICEVEGFSMPRPIVFADTNWVKSDFAFLVNPGTGKFELWRVDPLGGDAEPMVSWAHWLDGTQKKPDWGVFVRPYEYV